VALEFETLHHVAIVVEDISRSKRFYGEVLGLVEIARPPFPFDGAWYRAGDRDLHLIVTTDPTLRTGKGVNTQDGHLAFRVKSFRRALAYLESKGFRETDDEPGRSMRVQLDSVAGFPQIHLMDPDRNMVEINAEHLD